MTIDHATPVIVTEDFMVPSDTPGIELFIRNKRPSGLSAFSPDRTVLFIHGSSYPASTAFDLALDGVSWMDHMARLGYDAYLVDVRGYGHSTRPPEMDRPAHEGEPIVGTKTAVRDLGTAVEFILARRAIQRLCLVGWSWGTTLAGSFTADHPDLIEKLVLLAPQWLRTMPSASDMGGSLGAYRIISRADAKERWLKGVPVEKRAAILPDAWFEAWADATFATDPWGRQQEPMRLRAPNGTVQDSREYWAAGRPFYDPGRIKAPVLIVHADLDQELPLDMARTYFGLLTGAAYRRWVEIGDSTHSLVMERNRWQVFAVVDAFIKERPCKL
jgi:pimeloyl-ACP methyl ester carboxylesterase